MQTNTNADTNLKVVYTFPKNTRDEVRASIKTYGGKKLVDLRIYVENRNGEEVPTKKGLSLRYEQLPELQKAVTALIEAVESEQG